MDREKRKIAIVLFNLGGPDSPKAVRPFLYNLFRDPAIIGAPWLIRYALAHLISRLRDKKAQNIYNLIGGKSPILANTLVQARALENSLNKALGDEFKCFIGMRYWRPFISEAARDVVAFGPDKVILLPLYPQFSTTTTNSSLIEWQKQADRLNFRPRTSIIGCFPTYLGFVGAIANSLQLELDKLDAISEVRVLFTAHGLPEKIVSAGDPYQWQVEQTVESILNNLNYPDIDSVICYQSRVGPMKWIGPATSDEISRAGRQGKALLVVPVAFVSEHSETLVELDIEYAELAGKAGVPTYRRLSTVGANAVFIDGLAELITGADARGQGPYCQMGDRICPSEFERCVCVHGELNN